MSLMVVCWPCRLDRPTNLPFGAVDPAADGRQHPDPAKSCRYPVTALRLRAGFLDPA